MKQITLYALIVASTLGVGCSQLEPGDKATSKPSSDEAAPSSDPSAVTPNNSEESNAPTAITLDLKTIDKKAIGADEQKVKRALFAAENLVVISEKSSITTDDNLLVTATYTLSDELAQASGITDQDIFALSESLVWAIGSSTLTALTPGDSDQFAENADKLEVALSDLGLSSGSKLLGTSDSYLLFGDSAGIKIISLESGKLKSQSISLPTVASGEALLAAGMNGAVPWVASAKNLYALINEAWKARSLSATVNGATIDLGALKGFSIALEGSDFDSWKIKKAVAWTDSDVSVAGSFVNSKSETSGDSTSTGTDKKVTWITDIRILSDQYCVQCHTWAKDEIEWVKRLSDIKQRISQDNKANPKTMPQLSSVPADKITDAERQLMMDWLDLKKAGN